MTESNIDEDEDLIRQDSVLYVYLSKFGYTDFESIPIKKVTPRKIDNISFLSIATNVVKNIYRKLHFMYSAAIQEEELSQKQLTTLLGAKCILNDHAIAISNSINANYHRTWRYFIQELLFLCGIASPVYFLSQTDRITLSNFTMVYGVCLVCYTKYFRFCAYNNLKRFVSTQNQAFDLCRRAIKILGHDFRMKSNSVRNCQRFNDLTSGRLDYLQSLVESLIECMELFVFVNYKMSMLITKILPENHTLTTLTRFDEQSFNLCGEVTYKKLMNFYHIYVLTQSEMLLSLGLAYDIKTWKGLFRCVPEFKLFYMVRFMSDKLKYCKNNLFKAIEAYCNFKVTPIRYRDITPSCFKLQDLYIHLDLTAQKIETAHCHITSILNYINQTMDPSTTHNTLNKLISENLDDAQKQVEVAKDFLEYGRLLFVKKKSKEETNLSMNFENRSMNESSKNLDYIETKPNSNVEFDSTHQIVDEVFEEYIKEEYLKPLQEEGTGPFDVCKLDKFLVKNFMVELKETLIDVKKSMTERETMALKRLREGAAQLESSNSQHKSVELTENDFDKKSIELKKLGHENVLKDTIESNFSNFNTSIESKNLINEKHDALNSSRHENIKENIENNSSNSVNYNSLNIPVAPAMPSLNISPGSTDFSVNQKINVTLCCSEKTSKMNCKDAKHERKDSEYFICRDQENEKKKREIRSANKRNAELNSQKDSNGFLTQSPPIFLSEDIIEGSGENSEMEEI